MFYLSMIKRSHRLFGKAAQKTDHNQTIYQTVSLVLIGRTGFDSPWDHKFFKQELRAKLARSYTLDKKEVFSWNTKTAFGTQYTRRPWKK